MKVRNFSDHRFSIQPLARLIAIATVLAVVATACGSSEDVASDGVATLETEPEAVGDAAGALVEEEEVSGEDALLEFSQCMRDEGLDFPDIGLDANGLPDLRAGIGDLRDQDGFREAIDGCRPLLEGAGFGGGGGRAAINDNVEIQDAFVAFSQCLRDEGFDVGDLAFGQGPGANGGGNGEGQANPDADRPEPNAEGGRGEGGFGGRDSRFANQLGLDPDDPEVQAALEGCSTIIDEAFASAGIEGQGRN